MHNRLLAHSINYFMPAVVPADAEHRRRLRLIVYTVFFTTLFTFFYILVFWMAAFAIAAAIMLVCTLGFVFVLFRLRAGASLLTAVNLFGSIGLASIVGCSYFSGGIYSATLPWLAFPSMVMLLLIGKNRGYFWAALSVAAVGVFAVFDHSGFMVPKHYPAGSEPLFYFSSYAGLVGIAFLLALVFESSRLRALREVTKQKEAVEETLVQLKGAQTQLVHREKMASLGELTAGIAHEIQNPLNFVTNFSAVNQELLTEMKQEMAKGNYQEAETLATHIEENEIKIHHHGRRADSIVKGMLQHSRSSTGEKEPLDINQLVEEYLRLSLHGYRARDNAFHAVVETHYDAEIGKVAVVAQDISRVLLNLFNNAFYAVSEKKDKLNGQYEPAVSVSTKRTGEHVVITVSDNGTGMSEKVTQKVFQPFFTTKPTGEGTGLGLSLSYDIITKGHGGALKVSSTEGQGSTFTISLPVI